MMIKEVIKKLRMTICLDQKEFGIAIGVAKGSVCNYESGLRTPRFRTIRRMLELAQEKGVKMSVEDFLN